MRRRAFVAGVSLVAGAQTAPAVPPIRGLSRTNLLEYRKADGKIRVARTAKEWEWRRREALAGIDPDELTPKQALEALYALKKAASS